MNFGFSRATVLRRLIVCWSLAALGWIGASFPAAALGGAPERLSVKISARQRIAVVEVPPGIREVTLQRFDRGRGWTKVATRNARDGRVRFNLPPAGQNARWRALGRVEVKPPPAVDGLAKGNPPRKFPAGFYRGKNSFAPSVGDAFAAADWYEPRWSIDLPVMNFGVTSTASADSLVAGTAGAEPVEADIWRTDGSTVYFFNQLRGLQVLDLSNPADPRLLATLRLPAVGEDLYLLPGSGDSRSLVLLTKVTDGGQAATRIHMVSVAGGRVEITHHRDVPGVLAGSRMVGDKLALVTSERPVAGFRWLPGPVDSKTWISQWLISPGKLPEAAGQAEMLGANPVVAAGPDWLAVAVVLSWDAANSEVGVFGLGGAGLIPLTPVPVRTDGIVLDKFKLQWSRDVLTTISEKRREGTSWTAPVSVLENFRVPGRNAVPATAAAAASLLGRLELARGERLYATRFAGNKAYLVTFLRTDPLWVVDLTNPERPVVAGHLEVPGWSTYLEPVGDMLFSVGWESNTLAASLFDVADPAAPKLLRRLNLGRSGTLSEAAWNEKALKILPEAGLAMIPLRTIDRETGAFVPVMQILDLDLKSRDIRQRGAIRHEFDARRSEIIGDAVVSISQKALVAADIADRDAPEILSEVSLAWPVNRVLEAGAHLLQIESGASYGGRATLRVSPADDTEAVLTEVDLGDGRVCAAEVRDGRLFVLRDVAAGTVSGMSASSDSGNSGNRRMLHLDIHDLSALPALTLVGTCSIGLDSAPGIACDRLLWPRPHLPSVVLGSNNTLVRRYPVVSLPVAAPLPATGPVESFVIGGTGMIGAQPVLRVPGEAPRLLVFNIADAAAPSAAGPFAIGTEGTVSNGIYQAADGLFVMGAAEWQNAAAGMSQGTGQPTQAVHVVEIGNSGDPVPRPVIDLPGALFAVGDLDRDGFLAYTRAADSGGAPSIQVSACDGFDAFEITSLGVAPSAVAAAGGWRLFLAADEGVERFKLTEEGVFLAEEALQLGWKPGALSWLDGVLAGSDSRSLFAAGPEPAGLTQWPIPAPGLVLGTVSRAAGGDLLAPLGDYGAARLRR